MNVPAEELFLKRLEQIKQNSGATEAIDVLDLSAQLRQMLLDETPLMNRINRDYKLKVRFRVGIPSLPPNIPKPDTMSFEDALDPDTAICEVEFKELTKDEFVGQAVMLIDGKDISVRQVIKYFSDNAGGVHLDDQPNPKLVAMYEMAAGSDLGGLTRGMVQLKAIGRVTAKALTPLRQAVIAAKGAS